MQRKAIVQAALIIIVAALGSSPASARKPAQPAAAGRFLTEIVREKIEGNYARAWESLHPAHQEVVLREAYVACESLIPSPGTLAGVRATRVFSERIRVAGLPGRIRSRAVRVRVSVVPPGWLVPVVVWQTFHAIAVRGRWTWILGADQYDYYIAGTCPYA
jgi:hypothetical protein